ncbi:MAG: LysR family transcriptional regulator [Pseudomonadota bacterium]
MKEQSGRLTLWGIEVFLACADEGSISAAARRLGASVSAVSQQLSNLETALGIELIDRSLRPARLTPAGETFRRRALRIAAEAARARAELAAPDLSALTVLRLGMIEDFDADVTPRLLSGMAGELAQCRFLLETGASHRLYDLLETRGLDVIVAAETGQPHRDGLEVHPLLEEPFIAAVPKGAPADQAALTRLPMIQYTQRHVMGRQIAAHLAAQQVRLTHRFELDSYHAILAMVAAGTGWTILTPLGYLRAQRFRDEVDVHALPIAPLSRRICLTVRQGALRDMPVEIAARLKGLLPELIVGPATARMPWLGDQLRVL